MWIAASCRTLERSPWVYRFLIKLLERDEGAQQLLASDPWKNDPKAPKYIRVDSYIYRFHRNATPSVANGEKAPFWDREFSKRVYPPQGVASIESLENELPPERPI